MKSKKFLTMKPPFTLIVLSLLNLGVVGLVALKLSKVEARVAELSPRAPVAIFTPAPAAPPVAQQSAPPAGASDELSAPDMKNARDIVPYINRTVPGAGIEGLARTLAEMDEWLFRLEDADLASRQLEGVADVLRDKIAARIKTLSKSAIEAANGRNAAEQMSKVNFMLSLYPSPKTDRQRTRLDQITSDIVAASRRVEEIRRLRYNSWAIAQIEAGLAGYYNNKKTVGTNEDMLTKSCISALKVIDPALLEPAALDLYNYVFGLTRDAVSDGFRGKLAKGLADATVNRKSPFDF